MPIVSIVTPSYNQAGYLEQAIRSVLEQDYPQIEYLIIDGASNDGSVDIIQRYAHYLAHWVSERDSGQAEAINKGMARARGEIVAWLNSDDFYLPGTVAAAVRAFEDHPEALLVYGDMLAVDASGQPINLLRYRPLALTDLLCFQIIGQPAVFLRRTAWERAGGLDPSYHFLLDHHLWIRVAAQGPIVHIPQLWAAARYHAAAKNRAQAVAFGHEAFRILEWAKAQPDLAPALAPILKRATASAHRVNARYLLDGGDPWAGLRAWLRTFAIHPPTALARFNLLGSALLAILGLGRLREWVIHRRSLRYRRRPQTVASPTDAAEHRYHIHCSNSDIAE